MRSCGRTSSPTAHITFCTLTEVFRPQILIMVCLRNLTISCTGKRASSNLCRYDSRLKRCLSLRPVITGSSAFADDDNRAGHRLAAYARTLRPTRNTRSIQPARFLGQHDRDAGADGISELGRARDQLLLLGVVFQRTLGQRADQDFKQLGVDAVGRTFGG